GRTVALHDHAADAEPTSQSQPSERCAICAQPVPGAAIVLERGVPRHVTARAFAAACEDLFGAAVCAEHLRQLDPKNMSVLDVVRVPRCRTLNFPAASSLGTLHLHASPPVGFKASPNQRPASGVVIVPVSNSVWLEVDPNADLQQLVALGDLALDGIKLRGH